MHRAIGLERHKLMTGLAWLVVTGLAWLIATEPWHDAYQDQQFDGVWNFSSAKSDENIDGDKRESGDHDGSSGLALLLPQTSSSHGERNMSNSSGQLVEVVARDDSELQRLGPLMMRGELGGGVGR
jgi:hypothetical protein